MRRIGIRLWLVGAFAAVTLLTAGVVYLFGDRPLAVLGAIALGVLAGFLIALGISRRVRRLSSGAGELAAGAFDTHLEVGGRDEIGDLARALESMRASLKESFGVLTADRNKLKAIFDGLTDAVIVVDEDGGLRFSNRAAAKLLDPLGHPPESIRPHLKRAADVGFAAHPALRIGDRAYAMSARSLPKERAVLVVARDRTDEMRRELADAQRRVGGEADVGGAFEVRADRLGGMAERVEQLRGGAVGEAQAAVLVDHDHGVGEAVEDRFQLVAVGGEHPEALLQRGAHRFERPGEVADLVAAADLEVGVEGARGELAGAAGEPPHAARDAAVSYTHLTLPTIYSV